MIKYFVVFCVLFSLNLYAKKEVWLVCSESKVQHINFKKDKEPVFKNDQLSTIILYDEELNKFYVQSDPDVELTFIGGDGGILQFIESVASGHKVLFTYHIEPSILTTQKSYSVFGSMMVSIIQKCVKY